MRISDWSSDVCSSDLAAIDHVARAVQSAPSGHSFARMAAGGGACERPAGHHLRRAGPLFRRAGGDQGDAAGRRKRRRRSEEHTSELQTLMRISYAVFCLKKKKKTNKRTMQHAHYYT